MPDDQRNGVCLDTCFLITLCSQQREYHDVAKQYFQYWVEHGTPLFLPSICLAEYHAREEHLPPYICDRIKILPFEAESAVIAGAIERARLSVTVDDTPRDALKDDIKIIANACRHKLLAIATEDERSMARYARRAAETLSVAAGLQVLLLSTGFDEGTASFSTAEFSFE